MSGGRPEIPEEPHVLAGEYVLGVLESEEMRAVNRQASVDPLLSRAIAGWERRLAPMLTAVEEITPPDALWTRIARATSLAPAERRDETPARPTLVSSSEVERPAAGPVWARPAAPRRVWPWKVATATSLALAAGLAAIAFVPSLAPGPGGKMPVARDAPLVAVLAQPEGRGETRSDSAPQLASSDTGPARLVEPPSDTVNPDPAAGRAAGFLVAAWPDGTVVLTALAPMQIPTGKALELWIQPPGATAPKSLGVLAAAGRQVVLPTTPPAGTALSISVEPPDGSPTGTPTGRIVYAGTLREMRR